MNAKTAATEGITTRRKDVNNSSSANNSMNAKKKELQPQNGKPKTEGTITTVETPGTEGGGGGQQHLRIFTSC
jgi:hypothetical protein